MTTQQPTATTDVANGSGAETLTRHRQPDRHDLRAPDRRWNHPRHRSSPDQGRRRRLRAHDLRPRVHEHGVVSKRDHLPRRRQGDPALPRLPDRAARRARAASSRSPTCWSTASCRPGRSSTPGCTRSPITPSCTRTCARSCRASATTPTRWGCCSRASGCSARSTPRRRTSRTRESNDLQIVRLIAKMPTLGAFAYRHVTGKPFVYPNNELSYSENFLSMLFTHRRTEVHARPAHREGARRALHPARRPRAELLDQRGAQRRLVAGGPLLGGRGRRQRPLRPAARRRQRGGAPDAAAHREGREHPGLHRGREGGQGAPDGLRPPGLQELRPAGDDHQEGLRRRLRGHGVNPLLAIAVELETDRAPGRVLRQAQALPERRLLLGPDLRGAGHAGRRCSRSSSPSGAPRAGSPSGTS